MKILYVFPFCNNSSVGISKLRALKELGHGVETFDNRRPRLFNPNFIFNRVLNRFPKISHYSGIDYYVRTDTYLINRELIEAVKSKKPDLLLVDKGINILMETIRRINEIGIVTANWFPDNLDHLNWMKRAARTYKYFFHFDPYVVSLLKKDGFDNVYYLPFGCDPELHKIIEVSQEDFERYKCDVCFVGDYSPEREEVLSELRDFDLSIWGYKRWKKSKLKAHYKGLISNDIEMTKLYNSCKIALNIHYKYTGEGANVRTYEISGCGAFQLVDNKKDIAKLFKIDEEIVTYETRKELREKVVYYLLENNKRKEIGRKSQKNL
nr:hypothetical protein [Desulfobacterales bacterium]